MQDIQTQEDKGKQKATEEQSGTDALALQFSKHYAVLALRVSVLEQLLFSGGIVSKDEFERKTEEMTEEMLKYFRDNLGLS